MPVRGGLKVAGGGKNIVVSTSRVPPRRTVAALAGAIALVLLGSVVALAVHEEPKPPHPAAAAVRSDFEQFRAALLRRDGATASSLVTEATITTYERYRVAALTANRTELQRFSLIQQLTVLRARHEIDPVTLEKMNGKTLLAHAVDMSWTSQSTVAATRVDRVSVAGPVAAVDAVIRDRTRVTFNLQQEEGRWKIDLVGLIAAGNLAFGMLADERGLSDEEFLLATLEALSGRQVDASIWIPPR